MDFTCILNLIFNKYILLLLVVLLAIKCYIKFSIGYCRSQAQLVGKTIIVTGANKGIGKEVALDLAKRGARVILACRDIERANKARDEIIEETNNKNVIVKKLDLMSLSSVREFAKDVIKTERRLDVLINNAGVGAMRQKLTNDGLLPTMQVNHFSPFLLTLLLADLLKKSAPSRVVMTSSVAHHYAKLEVDKMNTPKACGHQVLYNNSKLCNVLFANELARRLQGTGVTVNSLHPGAVLTDIFQNLPKYIYRVFYVVAALYFKTPLEGAQTTISLAVDPSLANVTGKYFVDCKESKASAAALDAAIAKKVWEVSEKYVNLKAEEASRAMCPVLLQL